MRMDRRDFLKGLLAISGAVVALPLLPLPGSEVAAAMPSLLEMAPVLDFTPRVALGRLGRIRIDREWLPLNDASFTMLRRHAPLDFNRKVTPYRQPTVGEQWQPESYTRPLVDSPWEMQLWTPQPLASVHKLFDGSGADIEFEFDFGRQERVPNFFGRGCLSKFSTEYTTYMADDAPDAVEFSFVLEGVEKISRNHLVREDESPAGETEDRWWQESYDVDEG